MVNIPTTPKLGTFPLKTVVIGLILLCLVIAAGMFAIDHIEAKKAEELQQEQDR